MTKPLQVMSGEELMDMDYKPIKFAVREFLPQGLAILAGAPKTGKSFFRSVALPLRCEGGACLGLRNGKRNRIISLFGGQSIPSAKQNPYHNR